MYAIRVTIRWFGYIYGVILASLVVLWITSAIAVERPDGAVGTVLDLMARTDIEFTTRLFTLAPSSACLS